MELTEKYIMDCARVRMNRLKSDEDGNRPVGSWVTIKSDGIDEFIEFYDSMKDAINNAESGMQVAYIICNQTEAGLTAWYEDRNGNIHADYDSIMWEKEN